MCASSRVTATAADSRKPRVIPEPRRRAVYSAIIGGYERPASRTRCDDEHIDHLLFTDAEEAPPMQGWEVVRVQPQFPTDPVRSARYLKIIGHPALECYDETMWIDNRVLLRTSAEQTFGLLGTCDLAVPTHSLRHALWEEFAEVVASGYDDPARVRAILEIVSQAGLTSVQPLWTGILMRKRNSVVAACMRDWMDLLLLTSRRDQLSLNAVLQRHKIDVRYVNIDNLSSPYHQWVPLRDINRTKSIQMWRPPREELALRLADAFRSVPAGRKMARALSRLGLPVPTLPRP